MDRPPELDNVPDVPDLKPVVIEHAKAGTWAEFGVFKGNSARHWLNHMPDGTHLHLFDSFEGLPEYWDLVGDGKPRKINRFTLEESEIPVFGGSRQTVHKGLFADTLPDANMGVLSFVHIDCDLYSSTVTVLENIEVEPGTIMLFDEYHGYPNYREHERKAYHEWSERTGYKLDWLATARWGVLGVVT